MITQNELKEQLFYDAITGEFTRLISNSSRSKVGYIAGCFDKHNGYIKIGINGKYYKAHRLAWLYMTGSLPIGMLDHVDMNKINNAWINIRQATSSENSLNVGLKTTNKSGYKGVSFSKASGKWYAHAKLNGKSKHLGSFILPQDAAKAYERFAMNNHGEFFRI